jgi:hypothetical protein
MKQNEWNISSSAAPASADYSAALREIRARHAASPEGFRPCLNCNTEYRPTISHAEYPFAFCSKDCENTWQVRVLQSCSISWIQERVAALVSDNAHSIPSPSL